MNFVNEKKKKKNFKYNDYKKQYECSKLSVNIENLNKKKKRKKDYNYEGGRELNLFAIFQNIS